MRGLLAVSAMALLAACGVGNAKEGKVAAMSGTGSTRSFDAHGFDRVELRGSDNVIVRVGGPESVTATGPQEVLDRLEIRVVNGELQVGRKNHYGIEWGSHGHATVTVTLPRLAGASVAGSGNMEVDRAQAPSFAASLAGSGDLRIGSLTAERASLDIAGSGDVTIGGGQAKSFDVDVVGSGDLDAGGFRSDTAKISIAGSGNVKAGVESEADISVMGSGDVDITGRARCRVSKMGSGDVHCAG